MPLTLPRIRSDLDGAGRHTPGQAARRAEGWLWQTELDESVVQAATRLPPPARHRRITGTSTGAMALSGHAPPAATEIPAAT